jgi:hypothetical protein
MLLTFRPVQDASPNAKIIECIQKAVASIHQPGAEGCYISIDDLTKLLQYPFNGLTQECASDFLDYLLSDVFEKGFPELIQAMTGTVRITFKCKCGNARRVERQDHRTVALCIPTDGGKPVERTSVQEMVDNLSLNEAAQLEGKCIACRKNPPTEKKLVFNRKSSVSVMRISIFEWKNGSKSGQKLFSEVELQNVLTIRYKDGDDCQMLSFVIFHIGENQESGHFVARYKDSNGSWYQADDRCVTRVDGHRMDAKLAMPFIVVYTKIKEPDPMLPSITTLASRFEFYPLKTESGYSLFSNHFPFSPPSYHAFMPYVNLRVDLGRKNDQQRKVKVKSSKALVLWRTYSCACF